LERFRAENDGSLMATEEAAMVDADVRQWQVRRIDIRSPVLKGAWPVARLELEHPVRGRVTDIGKAPILGFECERSVWSAGSVLELAA